MSELPIPSDADQRRLLPTGGVSDERSPMRSTSASAMWNGVVWGRLGRGDLAWRWWDRVPSDGLLAPWLAAERGRVLRELGLHAEAQELELAGLEIADDLLDVVMLRLSLAADAVGLGDAETARNRLEAGGWMLDELPPGPRVNRQRLRRQWVAVEVCMLEGVDPPHDLLPRRDADEQVVQPPEVADGTDFHRAKGLLFAAHVHQDATLLRAAAELAPGALRWAVELARLDAGDAGAASRAVGAWQNVVPPPDHAAAVARTPTARRLAVLAARA